MGYIGVLSNYNSTSNSIAFYRRSPSRPSCCLQLL